MDFSFSEDDLEVVAGYRRVAEEVLGTEERPLDDPRLIYQLNLNTALGHLLGGAAYELGGHGYVTELWERKIMDWVICARRQHEALKRPFGLAAAEDQLLNLLNRLLSQEFISNATKPLKQGDKIRVRADETEWIDTLRLTSDPKIVDRRDSGLPVWRLELEDAVGERTVFELDRRGFEPAPRD